MVHAISFSLIIVVWCCNVFSVITYH